MSSYMSVIWFLAILSIFVTMLTNLLRHLFRKERIGKHRKGKPLLGEATREDMSGVYLLAIAVGVGLAAALRANIFDILKNPDEPAVFLNWGNRLSKSVGPWGWLYDIAGILVTGFVIAFLTKFWNDAFDIIYELKRWMRRKADNPPSGRKQKRGND